MIFNLTFYFHFCATLCRVSSPNSRRRNCRRPQRSRRRWTSWRHFCSKPSIPSTRPSKFPRVQTGRPSSRGPTTRFPTYLFCGGFRVWWGEHFLTCPGVLVWLGKGTGAMYCPCVMRCRSEAGICGGGPHVTCNWIIFTWEIVRWDLPQCGQTDMTKKLSFFNFVDLR